MSPPRRPKTPFDIAIEAEYGGIQRYLTFVCGKRGIRDQDALDAIHETFRIACEQELEGSRWDPKAEAITLHLGGILANHLRGQRRKATKRPVTVPALEHDAASENPTIEEAVEELEEEESQANEVRKVLAAETTAGLTLRILDALRQGIRGHEKLAFELRVSLTEVRNAFRRIARRTAELRKKGKGS